MARVRVWDLPLRLTHWLLAAGVITAFVTVKIGGNAMVWHGRAGLMVLGLVVFRVIWGFIGSSHARFASFVRGPAAIRGYLKGQWSGIGHNPLGALSVLVLLAVPLMFAATGLVANDDISFQGHLYALVSAELSDIVTRFHKLLEPLLIALVLLHIAAIGFYRRIKKHDLITPMITGWQETPDTAEPPHGGGVLAFLVAAVIAIGVTVAASGILLPQPQQSTAVDTPDW